MFTFKRFKSSHKRIAKNKTTKPMLRLSACVEVYLQLSDEAVLDGIMGVGKVFCSHKTQGREW